MEPDGEQVEEGQDDTQSEPDTAPDNFHSTPKLHPEEENGEESPSE